LKRDKLYANYAYLTIQDLEVLNGQNNDSDSEGNDSEKERGRD
jgi:hypothetical protein